MPLHPELGGAGLGDRVGDDCCRLLGADLLAAGSRPAPRLGLLLLGQLGPAGGGVRLLGLAALLGLADDHVEHLLLGELDRLLAGDLGLEMAESTIRMVPARTLSRAFMAVVRSLRRRSFSVSVMSASLAARSNAFGRLVACSSCLLPSVPSSRRPGRRRGGRARCRLRCVRGLWEVDAYRLRRVYVPVLPRGARTIRVLQISDLHLTPRNVARQRWLASLAGLEPDLVVDTGDNISHPDAVPLVTESLGRLLDLPGVFMCGRTTTPLPRGP